MPDQILTILGLAVLDKIRFADGRVIKDVLGGSGTFCAVGARLFASGQRLTSISWLIRVGEDFPKEAEQQIESLGIDAIFEKSPTQPSPRGLVTCKDNNCNDRTFQYTTTVEDTLPQHLTPDCQMLRSTYFHVLCAANAIESRVIELVALRQPEGLERPRIIWEPSSSTYKPENLQQYLEAVKAVDVFSTNHIELLALFNKPPEAFTKPTIESLAAEFLQADVGPLGHGLVVIRAAQHGCLLPSRRIPPIWLPAFYEPGDARIFDTTGAGNAFLCGLIMGHSETGDWIKSAAYGTVAASFLVEQIGPPTLDGDGVSGRGRETCNGCDVRERLGEYMCRLSSDTSRRAGY